MYFSGIFCPDLDEYIVPPTGDINLENVELINGKITGGKVFYFYPLEGYESPFPNLLRGIHKQEAIGELLETLDSLKKSSPEARKIRKRLREKGFHLKQPKEEGR